MALTKITPQMFDTSAAGHDFNIDNGTFVVDASANRVGIGTATPSTLLDVNGTLTATSIAGTLTTAAQTNITSVGTLTGLVVNGNASIQTGALTLSGANPPLSISNSGDAKVNFVRSSNTISYALSSAASGGHGFYDNAASAYDLYMKAGKVGIGTIAMSSYYSKNLVVMADGDNTGGITIAAPATDDTTYLAFADGTSGAATYAGYVGYTHNGDDLFLGAGGATRVTIDSTGNVGIGTSSVSAGFILEGVGDARFGDVAGDDAVEIGWSGGGGYAFVQAFDRSATAQRDLLLNSSLRIDSSGRVGIGVTPEAWTVFNPVLQIGGGAIAGSTNTNFRIFSNTYYGGAYKRIATGAASQYEQADGNHIWYSNPSAAADSTFTPDERMRIDSNGQIYAGGGPQSIAKFTGRANGAAVEFGHGNNSAGYYGTAGAFGSSGLPYIGFSADAEASVDTFTTRGFKGNLIAGENTGALRFLQLTNASATGQTPTERMRITSAGNVGIGNTVFSSARVNSTHLVVGTGTNSPGITLYSDFNSQASLNFGDAASGTASYDGGLVYAFGSGNPYLTFHVNSGVERMRIDSTGNVNCSSYAYNSSSGIMLYGPQGRIYTDIDFNTFGAEILLVNNRTAGGQCALLQYRTAAAIEGTIVGSSTGLAISNVSDYRKKQNIRNLTGSLNIIKSLQPRIYEYRTGFGKPEGDHVGFIAHEVQEHIPSMVDVEKDAVYTQEDIDAGATEVTVGQPKYQTVAYSNNEMITRLVQAMQEQQVMIETLQAEVTALKGA